MTALVAVGKRRKGKGPATRKQRNAHRARIAQREIDDRRRRRELDARTYSR